jgi:hypothetical protein
MRNASPDHLYLIGEGNGCGVVKIGRSSDPAGRLPDIQTGNYKKMRLLHVEMDAGHIERRVHKRFTRMHLSGEWFDFGAWDPVDAVREAVEALLPMPPEAKAKLDRARQDSKGCGECGAGTNVIPALLEAAIDYLFANHPDPAAYLAAQGFGACCISDVFRSKLAQPASTAP